MPVRHPVRVSNSRRLRRRALVRRVLALRLEPNQVGLRCATCDEFTVVTLEAPVVNYVRGTGVTVYGACQTCGRALEVELRKGMGLG